jgi:hypothetical protein
VILFAGALALPGVARADDYEFQYATGISVGAVRQTQPLSLPGNVTSFRESPRGKITVPGGFAFAGGYFDVGLTVNDRWQFPIIGAAVYGAAGSYDALVTSMDGSIVRLRLWTAVRPEILLPGIGYRTKHRRTQLGFALRTGASFLKMQGTVAVGGEAVPVELSAGSFMLQLEVEACRRLDPTMRICVHAAPRIFDHEFINGGIVGIRMEWGP